MIELASLTIYATVTGGLRIRGTAPDDTPIDRYKSTPTSADALIQNIKDGTTVRYYFKAPGYNLVKGTLDVGADMVHIISNATTNPAIPNADNTARSLSLEYDGEYGYLRYGYGLETPEQASIELDAILSTGESLSLIADYSEFDLTLAAVRPASDRPASDITVPAEVGRIHGLAFHDQRFYIVGDGGTPATDPTSVHKLFKFRIAEGNLIKDESWATNPQNVETTKSTKTIRAGGIDVWNNYIYIADGDANNNNDQNDKAMSVHRLDTGAREGIFTVPTPGTFPKGSRNSRFFMSGVVIDEYRNRMLILYKTHRGDISIVQTELRDRFLDGDGDGDGDDAPAVSVVHDVPATNLINPIIGTVDDTGVFYVGQTNGNVNAFDLNNGIALPLATYSTAVAISDMTIFKGVVLIAHVPDATRGLKAYALYNRKYTKSGDESEPAARRVRHPLEGENPLDLPITITQNGIIIDYDFIRIIPDETPQWRRRSLDANLVSRYGGKHVPHWTERGRVYLCSLDRTETSLGPAEAVPQPAIDIPALVTQLKTELPFSIWDYRFDPTDGIPAERQADNQAQAVAWYIRESRKVIDASKGVIDNTKLAVDNIGTSNREIQTDTRAIKGQTDKMIFNAQNHIRMDETVLTAEITTLTDIVGQARTAIEGDLDNVENYLRPMQDTLNALTQASIANAVWSEATDAGFGNNKTLKDIINFLGIVGIGTEELIDADGNTPLVKANAIGYAIRDKANNIRLTQKAKTSVDTDTTPLEPNAVKFTKEAT